MQPCTEKDALGVLIIKIRRVLVVKKFAAPLPSTVLSASVVTAPIVKRTKHKGKSKTKVEKVESAKTQNGAAESGPDD